MPFFVDKLVGVDIPQGQMARGQSRANSEAVSKKEVSGFKKTQEIFDIRERATRRLPEPGRAEAKISPNETLQVAATNFGVDLREAQKFVAGPGGEPINMMVPSSEWKKDVIEVANRTAGGTTSMHDVLEGVRRNYLKVTGYTGDKKVPKDVVKASLVYMDMVARGASRAFD